MAEQPIPFVLKKTLFFAIPCFSIQFQITYVIGNVTGNQRLKEPFLHSDGLFFDRLTKYFGGTCALDNVSMHVERGEIVALLGENGAGKSTLIKILGGMHNADGGRVLIDVAPYIHKPGSQNPPTGNAQSGHSPQPSEGSTTSASTNRPKVAFIHQDLGLIEWMTIAENIALAVGFESSKGLISWRRCEARAAQALKLVNSDFDPTDRISSLTRTEKSLVAIARALIVECDFLVLDEPTASLPADEVEGLFKALLPLRDKGVGMIYVSHRLDEIFRIADRVAVLRDGQMVGVRDINHTNPDELVTLIVGHKTREIAKPQLPDKHPILKVKNLQTSRVNDVSFALHKGEILGLVGLRGAGHEDIGRALHGIVDFGGEMQLAGKQINPGSPHQAIEHGIGFVAGDRLVESVAPSLSICENTFLNPMIRGRKLFELQRPGTEKKQAIAIGQQVGLSPNDPTLTIEALSGGNQQKVVVGRWLNTTRQVLIAEDPTSGVDVGAKAEIYQLLFDATESGMGILIVSTDFEEIAAVCHRALVFSRGNCVATLQGVDLSTENLIHEASAGEVDSQRNEPHAVH